MTRAWMVALIASLWACRIATVRPLESNSAEPVTSAAFDATSYVESIWNSRLVPTVEGNAADCAELLRALQADPVEAARRFGRSAQGVSYFLVKGSGVVVLVERESRNGLVGLDVGMADGKPDLWVQVGPVVNGMALRDAAGFITFDQFVNQVDYGDVGNALNQKVVDGVLKDFDIEGLKGVTLSFAGALSPGERLVLTPTRLSKEKD